MQLCDSWEEWDIIDEGIYNFIGVKLNQATKDFLGADAEKVKAMEFDMQRSTVIFCDQEGEFSVAARLKLSLEKW